MIWMPILLFFYACFVTLLSLLIVLLGNVFYWNASVWKIAVFQHSNVNIYFGTYLKIVYKYMYTK